MKVTTESKRLLEAFIEKHQLDANFGDVALTWFIPLAEKLKMHHDGAEGPIFVGINGCQGSGKSTLTELVLTYLVEIKQLRVINLSLDDFYFSKDYRQQLAQNIHPLLATRGVPGTHDTALLKQVLLSLKERKTGFAIPRFNKATDDPFPTEDWPIIEEPVDIILMEGWCWGVTAQTNEQLSVPVNTLESEEDSNSVWRTFVNQQLQTEYQNLYQLMDFWVMLKAPSFECVFDWRLQQEQKLIQKLATASNSEANSGIMSANEIKRFIQHYQRLTDQSLATLSETCDVVFELDKHRKIINVKGIK
ncbi:kinase [Aliiglaciecola sp. 2_MG-2023]|uniref:kinase n=1 Tax=unclassified Aliiglaciecola TaxID=2593648 RepID=UPI0026E35450|nr:MULTISPECIES: kinase [unclassified Aliiglaciecola]MDO6712103.1 kinase [Aliiglaciecola sp. 2_MG-2023]MDO6753183.1 kinase [Aliiglaciecola sp. 1_MG-2023]